MNKKFSMNKLFWGLLFLIGAVCLLLSRMGYWPMINNISIIDVLLTICFVWITIEGIRTGNFFFILFGLAFIAIQYDDFLHITAITPWTLLGATLLASIGLSIIFPHSHHKIKKSKYFNHGDGEEIPADFDTSSEEVIQVKNCFGSTIKYINTDSLVKANLQNSFGELRVYFDNTIIKNGVADINIDVSFGEATLYIPRTWHIENHVKTSFASIAEENSNQSMGSPILHIYGQVSFGEVNIVYI